MAKTPIDTLFEDACYKSGSKTPTGDGFVTGTFPGMEGNASEAINAVILEYSGVKAPAGPDKFGRVDNGE